MKILMVGIGGYAHALLQYFQLFPNNEGATLCGVVDPYAKSAASYNYLVENDIPVFDTIEEYFEEHTCDFAIVISPPFLHHEQCIKLLRLGVDVLCEKPIVPTLEQFEELKQVQKETGKTISVAFQWSYAKAFIDLKQDILDGKLGKVINMKTMVCFPRPLAYYETSTWKGRVYSTSGQIVNDNIAFNATAHYIHNPLFLAGSTLDTASNLKNMEVELYRCKDIETFDTVFIKGEIETGGSFLYMASHSITENLLPMLEYTFENAVVTFDGEDLFATYNDGTVVHYGKPNELKPEQFFAKILSMQRFVADNKPLYCTLDTVRPHLEICQKLNNDFPIHEVPKEKRALIDTLTYVPGLFDAMKESYDNFEMPKFYEKL